MAVSVLGAGAGLRSAQADQVLQETVDFGVPQTTIVTGLDFQAGCSVVASYQGMGLLDGGSKSGSVGVGPGPCDVIVTVLGVPIRLPILNMTPLGRFSFMLPGVAGFTFGLADVSIDLVTGIYANYTGTSLALDVVPHDVVWTAWGTSALTVRAHAGTEGGLLSLTAPYRLSMTFGIGVSVYFLGLRVFSVDLASLGSFPGLPSIDMPVTIDLRPTHVDIVSAAAVDSNTIRISWTQNRDSDFASYRIVVNDDTNRYVFVVDSSDTTSLTVPALPGKTYAVQVGVVDRAGQVSSWSSGSVTTPAAPPVQSSPAGTETLGVLFIPLVVVAGVVGILIGWIAGRRRRTYPPQP